MLKSQNDDFGNANVQSETAKDARLRATPLRVQFLLTSLPVGGAEVLLLNLIRKMDRRAFLPEVVCLKEKGELGEEMAREVPLHSDLLRSKHDVRIVTRLAKLFRERETDAVVTIGAGDKMFWGRLAARLAGVPVICSALHSTGWPDGVGRLNRLLTPITHGFIACADGHADYLKNVEKFPAERVFMIPNGVDTARFCPAPAMRDWLREELGIPPTAPTVGIVAALREEKNHTQFLHAAKQILETQPQCHFVIVGDGPERGTIESEALQLGIANHVHLLGNRSDTDRILQGLDVFCLTSKNEAKPVSILEALSCGVPAVAPDVGSVSESIQDGVTGFLTQPLSADATAQAILRLLTNPSETQQMGITGRDHICRTSSLEVMVSGYETLLANLYNQSAKRAGIERWQMPISPPDDSSSENAANGQNTQSAEPAETLQEDGAMPTVLPGLDLPSYAGSASNSPVG